jgi:hypothetical protein
VLGNEEKVDYRGSVARALLEIKTEPNEYANEYVHSPLFETIRLSQKYSPKNERGNITEHS